MRKLTIVFFDAGAGHRNAANALKNVAELQGRPWQIELLNLQELLDTIDPLNKVAHIRLQDGYNLLLRNGWTRFTPQLLAVLHSTVHMLHRPIVRVLERYWQRHDADLVLSVIPNFNRALSESVRHALPKAPFVTLMTDFADYPPHFWVERETEYVICGTQHAVDQAISIGTQPEKCFLVSGMILQSPVLPTTVSQSGNRAATAGIAAKSAHRPYSLRRTGLLRHARHRRATSAVTNARADDRDMRT